MEKRIKKYSPKNKPDTVLVKNAQWRLDNPEKATAIAMGQFYTYFVDRGIKNVTHRTLERGVRRLRGKSEYENRAKVIANLVEIGTLIDNGVTHGSGKVWQVNPLVYHDEDYG